MLTALPTVIATVALGAFLWTFAEYCLHRFAMHELHGKGIMSREHLSHHVTSSWNFDAIMLLSWTGVLLVGFAALTPVGWYLAGPAIGLSLGLGWCVGYFTYEYVHAQAHRRGPVGRYSTWLRHHHFHHHFGHPMANHGVSIPLWDVVFGTREQPEVVRVPRRLAMPWLLDIDGELRSEYEGSYVLVGSVGTDERQAGIDKVRAFASLAPTD